MTDNGPADPTLPLLPTRRRASPWAFSLVILLVGALAAASLLRDHREEPAAVRLSAVTRGEINSRVLAQGRIRARRQVEVASELSGRVTEVKVQLGDEVKVGDLLFTLEDEQYRVQVKTLEVALHAAEAMLDRASLALREAERNRGRDERLKERGVIAEDAWLTSAARVDLVAAERRQAEASVERAKLELQRAQDSLRKARVLAPIAGTIVDLGLEVGQLVTPGVGLGSGASFQGGGGLLGGGSDSSSLVIADLSELVARLDVDELDVAELAMGQEVLLSAHGEDEHKHRGVVTLVGLRGRDVGGAVQFAVAARVDPLTGAAGTDGEVRAAAPRLRPGMSVSAEIIVERLPQTLRAPVAAVIEGDRGERPDRIFVYRETLRGGEAEERRVKLGPTDGEQIAVLEGLEEGERVVEGPFRVLRALRAGELLAETKERDDLPEDDR